LIYLSVNKRKVTLNEEFIRHRSVEDDDDDFEDEDVHEEKKPKQVTPSKKKAETVFELGGKKKVTVGHFKGTILVNIREFYTDKNTGEEKVLLSSGIACIRLSHSFLLLL
jgi:hypothetical protein